MSKAETEPGLHSMRNRAHTPFNAAYPSVKDLRLKARKRIPRFAFEYLDGGCNEDVNKRKNTSELRRIELQPDYLEPFQGADMGTHLFGHRYDVPFGVAPIGLQGLMWPDAAEILARAAREHNLPFILSTVGTSSIEHISEITEGKAWFQLYNPAEESVRKNLIDRAEAAGCPVLVLLCDTPTFGFRPTEIKNGLSMPPRMTFRNILQIVSKPAWALETLRHGPPSFANLKPYMPPGLSLKQLGQFMDQTFSKRMDMDRIAAIRDRWKGKLVLKGVATEADAQRAIQLGLDGIIISNHGGRQLDVGEATIHPLQRIARNFGGQITVMMDSGIQSGPDIACSLASGARFVFLGRAFMYGVAALGQKGGNHTMVLLKTQLKQVMEQLGCSTVADFPRYLKHP